jgi:hypothetical protein
VELDEATRLAEDQGLFFSEASMRTCSTSPQSPQPPYALMRRRLDLVTKKGLAAAIHASSTTLCRLRASVATRERG